MEKRVRVVDRQQGKGDANRFMTPQLRGEIVALRQELREIERIFSDHEYVMEQLHAALVIARDSVRCLLTADPFAAWERRMRQAERESDAYFLFEDDAQPPLQQDKSVARPIQANANVTKFVTPEMRQDIIKLKMQISAYAACLGEAFESIVKLESLNKAVGLADEMQCVDYLESLERRKKREQAAQEDEASFLGDF
jgi:hypothetical protein